MEKFISLDGIPNEFVEIAGKGIDKLIDKLNDKELVGLGLMGMLTFAAVAIIKEM